MTVTPLRTTARSNGMRKSGMVWMVAALTVARQASALSIPPTIDVTLNARDRGAVVALACGTLAAQEFQAWAYEGDAPNIRVDVLCAAHGEHRGYPALKSARCDNLKGRWRCEVMPALIMKFGGLRVVLSHANTISAESAIEVATHVFTLPQFASNETDGRAPQRCSLTGGRSAPFEGAVNFDLNCEFWTSHVTKDCGGPPCRLFITGTTGW